MTEYKIAREADARAVAEALNGLYRSYEHGAIKAKGGRNYVITIRCKATGAYLGLAKMR